MPTKLKLMFALGKPYLSQFQSVAAREIRGAVDAHRRRTCFQEGALYHNTVYDDDHDVGMYVRWMRVARITPTTVSFEFLESGPRARGEGADKLRFEHQRVKPAVPYRTKLILNLNTGKETTRATCRRAFYEDRGDVTWVFLRGMGRSMWHMEA